MKNINRFFIDPDNFDSEIPVIKGSDVNHIAKVLRMAPGQIIEILDGTGRGAQASILTINNKEVALKIRDYFSPGGEPSVKITLVQGLSKGDKMEYVVQKATELGVADIIPMICHRSVVRLEGVKAIQRQDRWQRVALEAAKQCRRGIVPKVHEIQDISEILAKIPAGTLAFLPWEQEKNFGLGEILKGDKKDEIYIFIGPEGGFEPKEVKQAVEKGVNIITLGNRILRTETAGLACIAIVMFQWGDIN